jgi:hypothetical protein
MPRLSAMKQARIPAGSRKFPRFSGDISLFSRAFAMNFSDIFRQ